VPLEGVHVSGAATARAPSAVCLLFIALTVNKEKDNANGALSFITVTGDHHLKMMNLQCH